MLVFDVAVLLVDATKTSLLVSQGAGEIFASYAKWVGINLALAGICYWATVPPAFLAELSSQAVGIAVFAFALARTILDYVFGRNFLFP